MGEGGGVAALVADATCPDVLGVVLAGVSVPVLNPSLWPPSGVAALVSGDTATWAALCTDDDGAAWVEADPTRSEAAQFFADVETATGQTIQTIVDVLRFIDSHAAALTSDLQRWYGVDLRDLWRGILSYRQVQAYIDGLPTESATKTALRDRMTAEDFADAPAPEGWGAWSRAEELLAILIDRVAHLEYVTAAVQGAKPAVPEPFRRPGVGITGRAQRINDAITAAVIGYTREHNGAAPPAGWDHGVDTTSID